MLDVLLPEILHVIISQHNLDLRCISQVCKRLRLTLHPILQELPALQRMSAVGIVKFDCLLSNNQLWVGFDRQTDFLCRAQSVEIDKSSQSVDVIGRQPPSLNFKIQCCLDMAWKLPLGCFSNIGLVVHESCRNILRLMLPEGQMCYLSVMPKLNADSKIFLQLSHDYKHCKKLYVVFKDVEYVHCISFSFLSFRTLEQLRAWSVI